MASVKPKSPLAGDYKDEFVERTVILRGRSYLFRELDVSKYDELVELSTSKNDQGEDMLDNGLLRKLMTVATCVSPRLPDGLAGMPMRLAQKLTLISQQVNYGDEPEQCDQPECTKPKGHVGDHGDVDKEPDIQEGEPDDEGEGSPRPI